MKNYSLDGTIEIKVKRPNGLTISAELPKDADTIAFTRAMMDIMEALLYAPESIISGFRVAADVFEEELG